jgi:DNA polymerase III subunit beta
MKFSIPKTSFLEELQLLQGIVEKRNTMPILANILMTVSVREVELTGTDLEVGMKSHFEAQVDEPGGNTVNGKKLYEIIKSLPEDLPVTLEEKEGQIEIRAGASEFKLLCLSREDYPSVPEASFEKNIRLPLPGLRTMIERVSYAITQEQRYYLNGALLTLREREMELVSTDGHRLSFTSCPVEGLKPESEISVIVAKKTLSELKKLDDDFVEFDRDDNNLFFRAGNRTLISRVIESKFPNYQAVIPRENPHQLIVAREDLAGAVRRVSLLSAERSRGVKFNLEKDKIRLFSSNPEIGEARDKISVSYKGEDMEIGFNSLYMLEFLMTMTSENIIFEIKDENNAVLLRPETEDGVKNLYVLMPMKI